MRKGILMSSKKRGRGADGKLRRRSAKARRVSPELKAIREMLWPGGNMDAPRSPDTIDQIAQIARPQQQDGGTEQGSSNARK